MAQLELWRLGTDILLFVGLAWLSFHLVRSRGVSAAHARQGAELERSLRGLLKEADLASSSLHDQLLRRQQSLERVLRDLEGAESRANRAIMSAEGRVSAPAAASAAAEEAPRQAAPAAPRENWGPEAPSFNAVGRPTRNPAPRANKVQTNIFGEPIGGGIETAAANPPAAPKQSPLAASIEREVVPPTAPRQAPRKAQSDSTAAIAEVRRAAEDLLRAGRDLEFVANRTKLPLDEVRLLSQLVLREADERAERSRTAASLAQSIAVEQAEAPTAADPAAAAAADPRLGVLSPIRRSIETI